MVEFPLDNILKETVQRILSVVKLVLLLLTVLSPAICLADNTVCYCKVSGMDREKIEAFKQAIKINPGDVKAHYTRLRGYDGRSDFLDTFARASQYMVVA